MGILDKIKSAAKTAPAQQAAARPAQAQGQSPSQVFKFSGKLNKTVLTKEYVSLKSAQSLGTHVLKILKVNAGNLPDHKGGDEFFAASFEVVESDTIKPGSERTWMAVAGKFDYYEKDIKAFMVAACGFDPKDNAEEISATDFDAIAAEAIGESNPLDGTLIIAECTADKKTDKDGVPYTKVRFLAVPASEQAA